MATDHPTQSPNGTAGSGFINTLAGVVEFCEAWIEARQLSHDRVFSRKTSDESYTSDTTLNAVVGLSVTLLPNATYKYEALVVAVSSSETPDIKTQMSLPGGATLVMEQVIGHLAALSGVFPHPLQTLASADGTNPIVASGVVGVPVPLLRRGTITTGGTGGTLSVLAAQNTSNATATTVKAGSSLEAWRVA